MLLDIEHLIYFTYKDQNVFFNRIALDIFTIS